MEIILLFFMYFLPHIVAKRKKHPHKDGIFTLNMLLGWTVIGWIGAMVWANTVPAKAK